MRCTAHQQIFRRDQLLAVGQLAQRKFVLHVTNQVGGRGPHGARGTGRHDGVIDRHAGDGGLTVDVIAVWGRMVAGERARVIEGCRLHPQRIENLLLHRFVVSDAEFQARIDEMRADVSGGGGHHVAVLKNLAELAGGLHGSEES